MYANVSLGHPLVLLIGLALIALMVWAVIVTVRSRAMSTTAKIWWILVIVLAPLVGLAAWALTWFTGGRQAALAAPRSPQR